MQKRRYHCNYPYLKASEFTKLFELADGDYQLLGVSVASLTCFELTRVEFNMAELWFPDAATRTHLIQRQTGCCQRVFIRCPQCGKSKTKLYWLGSKLVCSLCGGLSYGSQSEGKLELLMRRVRRLRRTIWKASEVDVDNLLINSRYFKKPDRIHFNTYAKRFSRLIQAERQLWALQGSMMGL